jgi:hypothetical protein
MEEEKVSDTPTKTLSVAGDQYGSSTRNDQPVSANAFASGSNMNGAQVMTGRPTSRVLAPPGGHSSIKLG